MVRSRLPFVGACAAILVFGIVLAILGAVFGLPEMRLRLRVNLAQEGDLFLLLYLGIFCASLAVGPLIDYLGNKVNLVVSSAMVAAAMVFFAAAQSFAVGAVAAVLLGLGGGGLNTCANVLVSDLYGDQRGPMLNRLGIFFGIGALCVPLLAASIQGHFTVPQLFLFCAVLAAVCAFGCSSVPFPPAQVTDTFLFRDALKVARYDGIFLLGFILFLQSGDEACIGGWTSTYVNSTGYSPHTATLVLSAYWAALMLSRMLAAPVLSALGKSQVVLTSALIALAGCAILLWARSLVLLFAGTALIGLSYGPIFPTTLAIAGDRYSRRAGTAFGMLFSIALVGGMLSPWAVGQVSQRVSLHAGMIVPGLGATGISLLSAFVMRRERQVEPESKPGEVRC